MFLNNTKTKHRLYCIYIYIGYILAVQRAIYHNSVIYLVFYMYQIDRPVRPTGCSTGFFLCWSAQNTSMWDANLYLDKFIKCVYMHIHRQLAA